MNEQEAQLNNTNTEATREVHTTESSGHEHTLYAEEIFNIGGFPITNSLINSWIMILIVIIMGFVLRAKISLVPKGIQNIFEVVIDEFLEIFDSITGSRKRTMLFFPLVFTFFIMILINNWLGILPGVGSIGFMATENGTRTFVPFFRGGTADLNTTLALALIGVIVSHIFGIITLGAWSYFNKFINIKAILEIPKKVMKDPSVLIVNPIKLFVGFIEIISEIAKIISLSFRLFGNIFAGEVLLASMAAIFAFGLPIPFIFMEILVGLIQALIFAILILIYLTVMTSHEEH
ncbi:MAG: F0F1 ATP synthase subunit A [Candidatus Paceibacterota bacterium]